MEAIQLIQVTPEAFAGMVAEAVKAILPTVKAENDDALMNAEAAAKYLGITTETLRQWKKANKVTAYAHEGIVRYKKSEITQLLKPLR